MKKISRVHLTQPLFIKQPHALSTGRDDLTLILYVEKITGKTRGGNTAVLDNRESRD